MEFGWGQEVAVSLILGLIVNGGLELEKLCATKGVNQTQGWQNGRGYEEIGTARVRSRHSEPAKECMKMSHCQCRIAWLPSVSSGEVGFRKPVK